MTKDEAMKLALEALEIIVDAIYVNSAQEADAVVKANDAITALREALNASLAEQPTTQPLVVPDLLTAHDPETLEYRNGWNDCRQLMMEMYRREIK